MSQSQYVPSKPVIVAIAGANSRVGRMLLEQLQVAKMRTIALVRTPTILPAWKVISDWMVSPAAMQAMQSADILINLSGELISRDAKVYQAANVRTTELVVEALRRGRARRAIFLSYLGADPQSSNLYLQTKGQAEQLLLRSGKEFVIFRCPAIVNTPEAPGPLEENLQVSNGSSARLLGTGKQRQRPVYRGDVVAAIVAAIAGSTPGIYDLTGPEEMTADDLVRLVNRNPNVEISHTPAWLARMLSLFIPDLPPTLVDVMLRDCTGDPSKAVAEFRLNLTSLRGLWMKTAPKQDYISRFIQ